MTRKEKIVDIGEIVFKILFLTVGFLQYSSLTFGRPVISWVQWPMLILGAALIVYRLQYWRELAHAADTWLLLAFAAAYAGSSLVNLRYGWYDNARFFVFLVFQITLLYFYSRTSSPERSRRHTEICAWYYVSVTALLSLLSFVFLFCGIAAIYEQEVGPTYNIGFWWGRLFGAYWDPNIGAVMAGICCLLCVGLFVRHRGKAVRVFLIANIVLQLLYIEFSDSRAGKVCLYASAAVLTFLYALRRLKNKSTARRVALSAVCVAVVSVVLVVFVNGSGKVYNAVVEDMQETDEAFPYELIGREEDFAQDVSNRRFDIWGSALELFRCSPAVGVSHGNIVAYAQENLPDTYILNNDHMVFNTMHNVWIDILASQGILGLGLFLAAAIRIAVIILRKMPAFFANEHFYTYAALFSVLVAAVVSSLFMTELVYVISPLTLMFWIAAGCLSHAASADGADMPDKPAEAR